MKTWGKFKRVSVKNLKIGDKVAKCSTDSGVMKPNKKTLITIDKERLELLTEHKKLNYIFKSIEDMVMFVNESNFLRDRIIKYL